MQNLKRNHLSEIDKFLNSLNKNNNILSKSEEKEKDKFNQIKELRD